MVTAYTDHEGGTFYIHPVTGKKIGKGEAYALSSYNPSTGGDIADTGRRTTIGGGITMSPKADLDHHAYDVGTKYQRANFREQAGIAAGGELKGKKFRQARRRLSKQGKERDKIDKKSRRLEERARKLRAKDKGAKATRLLGKSRDVYSSYGGPRVEDFKDNTSDFYAIKGAEDYATRSKQQQASNVTGKALDTFAKYIMSAGVAEGVQAIGGASKAADAAKTVDEISKIEQGTRTAQQTRQLAKANKVLANPNIQKAAAKEAYKNTAGEAYSATKARQIGGEAWKTAKAAKPTGKDLFSAGKEAFKSGDYAEAYKYGDELYGKVKPYVKNFKNIIEQEAEGGGEQQQVPSYSYNPLAKDVGGGYMQPSSGSNAYDAPAASVSEETQMTQNLMSAINPNAYMDTTGNMAMYDQNIRQDVLQADNAQAQNLAGLGATLKSGGRIKKSLGNRYKMGGRIKAKQKY
jgi:hypothetical protein